MARSLNPKQLQFVAEYLKCGVGAQAARSAGYSKSGASAAASVMLRNPLVQAEITKVQAEVMDEAKYGLLKALAEAEEARQNAKLTENAAAEVKAVELKSKLSGLLVEKSEVKSVGFTIQIDGVND